MKGPLLIVFVIIIVLLAIQDGVRKLIAMWKSARNNELAWYVCLAIFNTAGILPLLYILYFQKYRDGDAQNGDYTAAAISMTNEAFLAATGIWTARFYLHFRKPSA